MTGTGPVWRHLHDLNGSTIALHLVPYAELEPCERCGIPVVAIDAEWLATGEVRRVWWQYWSELLQRDEQTGFEHRKRDCDRARATVKAW